MKTRRLYWDRHDGEPFVPARGDLVFGLQALYEVIDARPVDSAKHPDRWHLTMHRIGDNGPGMLDELARRPEAKAHGIRILNEAWIHKQRRAQAEAA